MKKTIILALVCLFIVAGLSALTSPRGYTQALGEIGSILPLNQFPDVTATSSQTQAGYLVTAYVMSRPTEVTSTATHSTTQIRLYKFGNGTTAPYETRVFLQFSSFATQWAMDDVIRLTIVNNNVTPATSAYWDLTIPNNLTSALTITTQVMMDLWPDAPPTHTLTITSNYVGATILKDGVTTGQVTDADGVVFTEAGLYSVEMTGVTGWTPANYQWDGTADMAKHFVGVKTPANPTIVEPADNYVYHIAWDAPATAQYTLKWAAPTTGPAPTTYRVAFDGAFQSFVVATGPLEYTVTAGPNTESVPWWIWQVFAEVVDPAKGTKTLVPVKTTIKENGSKDLNVEGLIGHFKIVRDAQPEVTVTPTADDAPVIVAVIGANPLPVNTAILPVVAAYICNYSGTQELLIPILPLQRAFAFYTGAWHEGEYVSHPGFAYWAAVPFGAKGDVPVVVVEPTLPVTLSSFTAVPAAQSFVSLTWVSESESNMIGYRVYRNESTDFSNATMITANMINATNTSTQVTYRHEDREVALNTTYYYWLESVDMASSELHGPITATVIGNTTPELPTATVMSNVYPNPFRMGNNANIDVALKAGDTGTVTVYNILGQSVKTFPVTQGTQKLTWNGRDSKGNACGSGIYFYKLSTPSMNQTKKMVIVK